MKTYQTILLWLFLLLPIYAWSQTYQNICSPGITYFLQNNNGVLKAFRSDSIILPGNNDSIFIAFPEVRNSINYPGGLCLDTLGGTVLGKKVYRRHDGWFFFFNSKNDTIRINTQAKLNDTWRFCDINAGKFLEAKASAIITDTIFGKTDEVKIISLQAKDNSGNNASSVFNQLFFKLSRNYGFTWLYDMVSVPFDTLSYTLAGKSRPDLGLGDLTMQKIYNFDVGDIFHYKYMKSYSSLLWEYTFSIKEILNKTLNSGNTVDYLVKICSINMLSSNMADTLKKTDTITEHYDFNHPEKDSASYYMPWEFVPRGGKADTYFQIATYVSFGSNRMRGVGRNSMYRENNTTCWVADNTNAYDNLFFCEGLGLVEEDYSAGYSYPQVPGFEYYLMYYKKGSKAWGIPQAVSCQKLLDIESMSAPSGILIRVTPNPVEFNAEISLHGFFPGEETSLVLLDCLGKPVFNAKYTGTPLTFQRGNIPAGIYLLLAENREGVCIASRKLVFR